MGSLVLRMLSSVYEDFIRSLESIIEKELATLADKLSILDEKTASEVRQIRKSGSTTLKYTELELEGGDREAVTKPAIVRHSPDSSFKHPIAGSQAPGLVVELIASTVVLTSLLERPSTLKPALKSNELGGTALRIPSALVESSE